MFFLKFYECYKKEKNKNLLVACATKTKSKKMIMSLKDSIMNLVRELIRPFRGKPKKKINLRVAYNKSVETVMSRDTIIKSEKNFNSSSDDATIDENKSVSSSKYTKSANNSTSMSDTEDLIDKYEKQFKESDYSNKSEITHNSEKNEDEILHKYEDFSGLNSKLLIDFNKSMSQISEKQSNISGAKEKKNKMKDKSFFDSEEGSYEIKKDEEKDTETYIPEMEKKECDYMDAIQDLEIEDVHSMKNINECLKKRMSRYLKEI